ncbi:MAG: LTA synthase family protein [Rhodospirillaceae bacterium]
MILFALCLCAAMIAMMLMERWVLPKAERRPVLHRMSALAAMPVIVLYVTIFMVSYRPVFSLVATLIVFAGIVVVNNAKYAALKEPLVFSDFALLRQAIAHPALYVNYIGLGNIIMVMVAALGAIAAGLIYEPTVIRRDGLGDFFPTLAYLFVVLGMIYATTRGPLRGAFAHFLRRFGADTDVGQDMDKLSLVVCLIFYFYLSNEPVESDAATDMAYRRKRAMARALRAPVAWGEAMDLPDIVMVQSESFFDVRRVHPTIPQNVLTGWDGIKATAAYHGRLTVPAWGANTMRTEFAVLSGLPNDALGVNRFNPYLSLAKQPIWTMAHQVRAMGYRTVCVHPYASNFFDRDVVFPNLGFDVFIDITEFAGAKTFGPYISDQAVADKILDVLKDHDGPQFVFAITMENHGKWELDRLAAVAPEVVDAPLLGSPELAMYVRHIANADAMASRLTAALDTSPRDSVFCMFGDHVPSLPDAFRAADFHGGRTDYVVWRKGRPQVRALNIGADALGRLVLDAALNQANHAAAIADVAAPRAMS